MRKTLMTLLALALTSAAGRAQTTIISQTGP
jgi:hypothetical protein